MGYIKLGFNLDWWCVRIWIDSFKFKSEKVKNIKKCKIREKGYKSNIENILNNN
jgi:hypothetical protein